MTLEDGEVLAERHAVAYTPSATVLVYSLRNRPATGIGGKRSVYVAGTSSLADAHLEFFEADSTLFDAARWEVTTDLGPAATPDRAREQLEHSDVAHITCHGYFDSERPLLSGLLLASGRGRPPRDLRQLPVLERREYVLNAQDLLRTPIRTDLLMLRACSGGLQGERNAGDELDGLVRSMIYAGCRSLVVSLWNVDQESSLELARAFYEAWSGTPQGPKWRALWTAQRQLRNSVTAPFLNHPYHWAPFVLVGDWR
jgi:CHAT domain-containing protein